MNIIRGFSCNPKGRPAASIMIKLSYALMLCGDKYHETPLIGVKIADLQEL